MQLKALFNVAQRSHSARSVVLWMFAAVLVVQGVLFIPNLWLYEDDLMSVLTTAEREKLNSKFDGLQQLRQVSALRAEGRLLGATVYSPDSGETLVFGKIPSLAPSLAEIGNVQIRDGRQADVVWQQASRFGDLIVSAQLDVSGVRSELQAYALRLLSSALLVSAVVAIMSLLSASHYFHEPFQRVVELLRRSRLEGVKEIKGEEELRDLDEFSGLFDEYNCMISKQREAGLQLKLKQQTLEYQAHHCMLTQLPNRLKFDEEIKRVVPDALGSDQPFALFLLDIDNFKFFNDQYGHDVGDQMVLELARRLQGMMRSEVDMVARLDGDEFVVLQRDVVDVESTHEVARRMLHVLSQPIEYRGFTLKTTASIGVSFFPDDVTLHQDDFNDQSQQSAMMAEEIVNNASVALQEAKNAGRGTFLVFNEAMRRRITERMRIEEDLKSALVEGQFEVFYQPKVNMQTGEAIGAEALVRWHHPTMGNIRPDVFIPVAEESGLIIPLGQWILETACRDTLRLRDRGIGDLQVAVNISAVQFTGGDLLPMVQRTLDETGLQPSLLELEITESAVMHDPEDVIRSLHQLSRHGIGLAIDDFGTGYSSLAYLKRFPVDTLKIDRAFIKDISRDSDDVVIVEAVLGLGKHFGLKVVAEGVEDIEQLDFLRRQGCDIAQGYHLSPPLAFDQYAAWLEDWNRERAKITAAQEEASSEQPSVVRLHRVSDGKSA